MLVDDTVRHGESQPGSFTHILGGKEGIKNFGQILRGDSFARIGDFETELGAVAVPEGPDAQNAPVFHGLDTVYHKVN